MPEGPILSSRLHTAGRIIRPAPPVPEIPAVLAVGTDIAGAFTSILALPAMTSLSALATRKGSQLASGTGAHPTRQPGSTPRQAPGN